MSAHADHPGAGSRPASPRLVDTERLVVVRRDRFEAFAVLAQAYAGEPGVRLVWDRRRRERRGSAAAADVGDRRQRDRRASPALAMNDYLVFSREQPREPGALTFVHQAADRFETSAPSTGDNIRREIDVAAESELPVLISGGDTISRRSLARRLHDRSGRAERPFRVIDRHTFIGLCDQWIDDPRADLGGLAGGTVFIEEVAHWTLDDQAQCSARLERIARARHVNGASVQPAPLRIVSGSACCLIDLVHDHQFCADLFYRLNMVHLMLPPGIVRPMA
jgi:transcriptional regulator of acetoin/glycerol metabolism